MPLVKDINVSVTGRGTTATVTFAQLYEGEWDMALLDYVRPRGTRTWKAIHNPDVLPKVVTIVTREMNTNHGQLDGPARAFGGPWTPPRMTLDIKPDAMADAGLLDLTLSEYRKVVSSAAKAAAPKPVPTQPVRDSLCHRPTCKRRRRGAESHYKSKLCADA